MAKKNFGYGFWAEMHNRHKHKHKRVRAKKMMRSMTKMDLEQKFGLGQDQINVLYLGQDRS